MGFILIYTTTPTKKEAKKIARYLLKKRLIACANIFPINSLYWWKGKIVYDNEFVLIAKTIKNNFEKVKKEVEKLHSYKIPCIIKISVSSNKKFFNWLKREIKKSPSGRFFGRIDIYGDRIRTNFFIKKDTRGSEKL